MIPSLSEIEISRLRSKSRRAITRAKEWFIQAVAADVASHAFRNHGDHVEAGIYRDRAIYSIAKGFESLAFESSKP